MRIHLSPCACLPLEHTYTRGGDSVTDSASGIGTVTVTVTVTVNVTPPIGCTAPHPPTSPFHTGAPSAPHGVPTALLMPTNPPCGPAPLCHPSYQPLVPPCMSLRSLSRFSRPPDHRPQQLPPSLLCGPEEGELEDPQPEGLPEALLRRQGQALPYPAEDNRRHRKRIVRCLVHPPVCPVCTSLTEDRGPAARLNAATYRPPLPPPSRPSLLLVPSPPSIPSHPIHIADQP